MTIAPFISSFDLCKLLKIDPSIPALIYYCPVWLIFLRFFQCFICSDAVKNKSVQIERIYLTRWLIFVDKSFVCLFSIRLYTQILAVLSLIHVYRSNQQNTFKLSIAPLSFSNCFAWILSIQKQWQTLSQKNDWQLFLFFRHLNTYVIIIIIIIISCLILWYFFFNWILIIYSIYAGGLS